MMQSIGKYRRLHKQSGLGCVLVMVSDLHEERALSRRQCVEFASRVRELERTELLLPISLLARANCLKLIAFVLPFSEIRSCTSLILEHNLVSCNFHFL
jgi:hypothetical protein